MFIQASLESLESYSCADVVTDGINGYIQSPGYPNYISGVSNCLVKVLPVAGYGLTVYIVQISMSDRNEQNA